jgi:hypothetical protein
MNTEKPSSTVGLSLSMIDNRPYSYKALFNGELPYEPKPDPEDLGLAAFTRSKGRSKGLSREQQQTKASISEHVANLINKQPRRLEVTERLEELDIQEANVASIYNLNSILNVDNPNSIFSFICSKQEVDIIASIVSKVLSYYELALSRDGSQLFPSVNNKEFRTKQDLKAHNASRLGYDALALELAASVMQVLPIFTNKNKPGSDFKANKLPSSLVQRDIVSLLTKWGPAFIQEWFDDTIIKNYLISEGLDHEQQQYWLGVFNWSTKSTIISNFISNPLDAVKRIKHNLEHILTDENIARELSWDIEEVRSIITSSMKKVLASTYISNPLEALRKVKYNLENILSDENISKELNWDIEEVRGIITPSIKKHLAISNISNPLEALRKVKYNLENILSDENIATELDWNIEEVKDMITLGRKKYLAINYISNPLGALKKIKYNLENILTNENIAIEFDWDIEEVKDMITLGMKKHLAINHISNPLEALRKVKYNLENILSEDNIVRELNWDIKEVKNIITPSIKKRLAINHISNPLEALRKVKYNLENILSDENIATELDWNIEEVRGIIVPWMKKDLAISYISDPIEALRKVKYNLKYILTDENIANEFNLSVEEVKNKVSMRDRRYFALFNISDPLKGLENYLNKL